MKIFSLQSKMSLAVWSVILGTVLEFVVSVVQSQGMLDAYAEGCGLSTSPFRFAACGRDLNIAEIGNWLFWILMAFILLGLIRYKNKIGK